MKTTIAVADGDGAGPEIMRSVLHILDSAGASVEIHKIEMGESAYRKGFPMGLDPSAEETIRRAKILLKGPTALKSLPSTLRRHFGVFAQVIPCISYDPYIESAHPTMNVTIIRESPHPSIEYRQSPDVRQSIELSSRIQSEKIIRIAFEYAERHQRKIISCLFNDGKLFEEMSKHYPDILTEDLSAAALVNTPEIFDVVILPSGHLFCTGAAEVSFFAEIGDMGAIFEGSTPSGLLLAAVDMLVYSGHEEAASRIHNAYLKALEEGLHKNRIDDAVIRNLGKKPRELKGVEYRSRPNRAILPGAPVEERRLVGIDVAIYHKGALDTLLPLISHIAIGPLHLRMVSNRGISVWPNRSPLLAANEQWCCRFTTDEGRAAVQNDCIQVLHAFDHVDMDVIYSEHLYQFSGKPGYPLPEE